MDDELTLSPLRLTSTEELIAELQSRFESCVILTLEVVGDYERMHHYTRGGGYTAIGMATQFIATETKEI